MKNVNNYKLIGYGGASLGIIFFIIAVITRIHSVTEQTADATTISYPYQFLSAPYLVIGVVFIIAGISGFWISYLKFERLKLKHKPIQSPEKTVTKVTYGQDFQGTENSTTYNLTYNLGLGTNAQDNRIHAEKPIAKLNANSIDDEKRTSKNLSYMLFALGAILVVAGIYLCTYNTVTMVNNPYSVGGYATINIPQAEQIQPYQSIGIIIVIFAIILIAFALYNVSRKD